MESHLLDCSFCRLLADVDDDKELIMIRDARMKQLQQQAAAASVSPTHRSSRQMGELLTVAASNLLALVSSYELVVAILCRPNSSNCGRDPNEGRPENAICSLMAGLATQHPQTAFARVDLDSARRKDPILAALHVDAPPAIVCFREGAIVRRAVGDGGLRQFVGLGDIGPTVFRAWLAAAELLRSPGVIPAAAGPRARGKNAGSSSDEDGDSVDESRTGSKLVVTARHPPTRFTSPPHYARIVQMRPRTALGRWRVGPDHARVDSGEPRI